MSYNEILWTQRLKKVVRFPYTFALVPQQGTAPGGILDITTKTFTIQVDLNDREQFDQFAHQYTDWIEDVMDPIVRLTYGA
jgi:hypothetical protein